MEFEYPLILVAKKEFLESFQNGYLYLVNSLHYQQMENEDPNRGDKYDGAIKCSYNAASYILPIIKLTTINFAISENEDISSSEPTW